MPLTPLSNSQVKSCFEGKVGTFHQKCCCISRFLYHRTKIESITQRKDTFHIGLDISFKKNFGYKMWWDSARGYKQTGASVEEQIDQDVASSC